MMALLLAGLLLPGRRLVARGGEGMGEGDRRDADTSSGKAGGIGCWEGCAVLQSPGEAPEGGGRALEPDTGKWGLLLTALSPERITSAF